MKILSNQLELVIQTIGSGHPLVFAHGLTGTRQNTLEQFSPLTHQYQVVAFDQRGHGQSAPVTDPAQYNPKAMADDMAAVMDALGIEQAVVGGESMGSATALSFALRWPERIKALLLTAPAFGHKPNTERERFKLMADAIEALGMETFLQKAAERQRDELGWPDPAVAAVARNFSSHNPSSIATACRTVVQWVLFDDLSPLKTLPFPVCIIAWPGDPLHPLSLAERMATSFPKAHLKILSSLFELFEQPHKIGQIYGEFLAQELYAH